MDNEVIAGIGEVLWDVLPEGKKIGGAPANFAYHVSQFGLDSCVVSAIGDDKPGTEILEDFAGKGMNHLIEVVPYPTGTVQVEIDQAFIASIIKGKSVPEAHSTAVKISAYVCTQNGAMPLLPEELTD